MKNHGSHNRGTNIEVYIDSSGETFLRKGSSDGGATLCHCVTSPCTTGSHPRTPIRKKIKTEVFGREFERSPFFKRGSLNSQHKSCYISITIMLP